MIKNVNERRDKANCHECRFCCTLLMCTLRIGGNGKKNKDKWALDFHLKLKITLLVSSHKNMQNRPIWGMRHYSLSFLLTKANEWNY